MKNCIAILVLLLSLNTYAQIPAGYYNGTESLSGEWLKSELYSIIKGHTTYPYTSTGTDVWDILKVTDRDTNNPENVILIYTGWSVDAAQEYNNGSGWTREHVWAKSRGDFGISEGAGTDAHHLRPCDVSVNSARNNRWFAECDEQYYDDGGTIPTDSYTSSTDWVWKPRDEVKGDVARMIFYMATRYEGENGEPNLEVIDSIPSDDNTIEPIHALLSDLLAWHQEDPVDDWERRRNDTIYYHYQHNRNPFIDHPEFVGRIWGNDLLPQPTNHVAGFSKDNSVLLEWNNSETPDHYYLMKNTTGCGNFTIPTDGNGISEDNNNIIISGDEHSYKSL